jgi:hypothetical protein
MIHVALLSKSSETALPVHFQVFCALYQRCKAVFDVELERVGAWNGLLAGGLGPVFRYTPAASEHLIFCSDKDKLRQASSLQEIRQIVSRDFGGNSQAVDPKFVLPAASASLTDMIFDTGYPSQVEADKLAIFLALAKGPYLVEGCNRAWFADLLEQSANRGAFTEQLFGRGLQEALVLIRESDIKPLVLYGEDAKLCEFCMAAGVWQPSPDCGTEDEEARREAVMYEWSTAVESSGSKLYALVVAALRQRIAVGESWRQLTPQGLADRRWTRFTLQEALDYGRSQQQ